MIVFVYGTRPEAIKIGPIVAELREANPTVVCTGQHTTLLSGTPAETDLEDGITLAVESSGDVTRFLTKARAELIKIFKRLDPQSVVVQGDTMSAAAGADAAFFCGIPIVHVEAGVRSHCDSEPWPEEMARVQIDAMATWHLAATEHARRNLLEEDVDPAGISVCGNSSVSALRRYAGVVPVASDGKTIIMTLHRRELRKWGRIANVIADIMRAAEFWKGFEFLWPVHPAMKEFVPRVLPENVRVTEPLPYMEMAARLAMAHGILTDSGGLVEEAATLGVPTAIIRNHNDRPEAVEAGIARIYPPDTVYASMAVDALCRDSIKRQVAPVYGDADAAKRIAALIGECV